MIRKLIGQIKKLYKTGALHITLGTFATKFVAFFGSIVVVRLLTKDEYGTLSFVENLYSYALILAGLGLSNGLLRFLVIHEESARKKSIFNYVIYHSAIRNIVLLILMGMVSQFIPFPDNFAGVRYLCFCIAFLIPFQDLVNDVLYTLRAYFENKIYAYFSFFVAGILIVGRIIGARCYGTLGVVWSRVLINALMGCVGYIYVRKRYFKSSEVVQLTSSEKKELNIYSVQYMLTNGFWAMLSLNDTMLMGLLMNDPVGLADYKVAYVIPGNLAIFATAIGVYVAPYFTKNEKDTVWVKRNFIKIFFVNCMTIGFISMLIGLLARPLILFIYGDQYSNIIGIMRLLLFVSFLNSGVRYPIANILAAMGKIKYNMIVSFVGIFIQIILDFILIPSYGIIGVAVGNGVVYAFMAITLLIFYYKTYIYKH